MNRIAWMLAACGVLNATALPAQFLGGVTSAPSGAPAATGTASAPETVNPGALNPQPSNFTALPNNFPSRPGSSATSGSGLGGSSVLDAAAAEMVQDSNAPFAPPSFKAPDFTPPAFSAPDFSPPEFVAPVVGPAPDSPGN